MEDDVPRARKDDDLPRLLHDFSPSTEFTPAGLTEADLDLRIIEITALLIERLRAAGLSFAGLPEPRPVRAPEPSAQAASEPAAGGPSAGPRRGPRHQGRGRPTGKGPGGEPR